MTTNDLYVLHTGIAVDGAPGRVTVFDYEKDAQEVFEFMVNEVLVSINQGISITRVSYEEGKRDELVDSIDRIVEDEFDGYDHETITSWNADQSAWIAGTFDDDDDVVTEQLTGSSDILIHG